MPLAPFEEKAMVRHAAHFGFFGVSVKLVKERARFVGNAFNGDGSDLFAGSDFAVKNAEAGVAEERRGIRNFQRIAQVGFVAAVFDHGFTERNPAKRRLVDFLPLENSLNTPLMTYSIALKTSSWVAKDISISS